MCRLTCLAGSAHHRPLRAADGLVTPFLPLPPSRPLQSYVRRPTPALSSIQPGHGLPPAPPPCQIEFSFTTLYPVRLMQPNGTQTVVQKNLQDFMSLYISTGASLGQGVPTPSACSRVGLLGDPTPSPQLPQQSILLKDERPGAATSHRPVSPIPPLAGVAVAKLPVENFTDSAPDVWLLQNNRYTLEALLQHAFLNRYESYNEEALPMLEQTSLVRAPALCVCAPASTPQDARESDALLVRSCPPSLPPGCS